MIDHPAYPVEPWTIRETEMHLDALASSESVFALSNGHIGLRGNLDEGEPYGLPGTYLGGFYETRPLPYAEAGFGYPEDGQTVVNVTNGKLIRLLVEDEPFDLRYGNLISHERVLDLRDGVLRRTAEWVSPTGRRVKVSSTRFVSFTHRAIAAIEYIVEPLDESFPVVVQSQLVANESGPRLSADPRAAAALAAPLESEWFSQSDTRAILVHRTKQSGLRIAAAMDHLVEGPNHIDTFCEVFEDLGRFAVTADLEPGKPLRLLKLLAYGWSAERSVPALRDQVAAAGQGAKHAGWEGMLAEQRAYLDNFWERSDVELEGDAELQQALRFALFHTLQAGARGEQRAIAAKGLTGPGYDGHTFWDTESFVLPVLTYTAPHAAADALRWRQQTLDLARDRARTLGLKGASFPWRTIRGQECSSYWPAGTAAFHINADIADAVIRYVGATEDEEFERETALELLVETARLWRSLGHHDSVGRFRIDGVTGPDEYSAIVDNNIFTNLMAQRNLAAAADLAEKHDDVAEQFGVTTEEAASWRDAAKAMMMPYDRRLGVHPQHEGFTEHAVWDFNNTPEEGYPLLLHYPYFDLYRKQVVKQADLVLAIHLRGDAFTDEQKARDFAYYEPITVRDSSLSACTQAVVAAEVGQLELAHEYLAEAALMDLRDLERNTRDGMHMASLAGAWIALVQGFGGMRQTADGLTFAPRLPSGFSRLKFHMRYRGRLLRVTVTRHEATYELVDGDQLIIQHFGAKVTVGEKATRQKIPAIPEAPRLRQPKGREPITHRD